VGVDYDIAKRAYHDGNDYISRRILREKIDKLLDHTKSEATKIARKFDAGTINAAEFEVLMRELLKSSHIVSGVVGRGGRERMTQSDWGRIGAKIAWQNGYLAKFARKLSAGTLSKAATANRARSYVGAVYTSFAEGNAAAYQEAKELGVVEPDAIQVRLVTTANESCAECEADEAAGWMNPDDLAELGTRICGDWCKCFIEFSDEI